MTQLRTVTITGPEAAPIPPGDLTCRVCGLPTNPTTDGSCRNCDHPVHIAWREERPEAECSRIAPSNACGVSFVCVPCYAELGLE